MTHMASYDKHFANFLEPGPRSSKRQIPNELDLNNYAQDLGLDYEPSGGGYGDKTDQLLPGN